MQEIAGRRGQIVGTKCGGRIFRKPKTISHTDDTFKNRTDFWMLENAMKYNLLSKASLRRKTTRRN